MNWPFMYIRKVIRRVIHSIMTRFTVAFSQLLLVKKDKQNTHTCNTHVIHIHGHVCSRGSNFSREPTNLANRSRMFVYLPCSDKFNSLSLLDISVKYASFANRVVFKYVTNILMSVGPWDLFVVTYPHDLCCVRPGYTDSSLDKTVLWHWMKPWFRV